MQPAGNDHLDLRVSLLIGHEEPEDQQTRPQEAMIVMRREKVGTSEAVFDPRDEQNFSLALPLIEERERRAVAADQNELRAHDDEEERE